MIRSKPYRVLWSRLPSYQSRVFVEPAISPMSSPATSKTKPHICSTKTVDPAIKRQASSLATSKVDLSVKQLASSRSSLRRPLTSRHHSFLRRHRSVTWIRFCEQLLPSFFLGPNDLTSFLEHRVRIKELLQLPHGPSLPPPQPKQRNCIIVCIASL